MPRFNGTGPFGHGPVSGRRLGRCTNFGEKMNNIASTIAKTNLEEYQEKSFGQGGGLGQGRNFGFGRGRQFNDGPMQNRFCRRNGNGRGNRFGQGNN
ncbi:hypothetical protein MASR2M117_19300 [Paludibacter sp.]